MGDDGAQAAPAAGGGGWGGFGSLLSAVTADLNEFAGVVSTDTNKFVAEKQAEVSGALAAATAPAAAPEEEAEAEAEEQQQQDGGGLLGGLSGALSAVAGGAAAAAAAAAQRVEAAAHNVEALGEQLSDTAGHLLSDLAAGQQGMGGEASPEAGGGAGGGGGSPGSAAHRLRLLQLRGSDDTYTQPAEAGAAFAAWAAEPGVDVAALAARAELEAAGDELVAGKLAALVPARVPSEELFWRRYAFAVAQAEREHARKAALCAEPGAEDELSLSWDSAGSGSDSEGESGGAAAAAALPRPPSHPPLPVASDDSWEPVGSPSLSSSGLSEGSSSEAVVVDTASAAVEPAAAVVEAAAVEPAAAAVEPAGGGGDDDDDEDDWGEW